MVERGGMRKEAQAPFNHAVVGSEVRDRQITIAREVAEWRRSGEAIQALLAAGIVPASNFTEPPSLPEQNKGISFSRPVLIAATLGLLATACARERGMEFPVNTPATTAPTARTGEPQKSPPPQSAPEQKFEPGWESFSSVRYPYKINYPSNLTPSPASPSGGVQRADRFYGEQVGKFQTTVGIFAEPVESWVTLDVYLAKVKSDFNSFSYIGGGVVHTERTRVDGRDAYMVQVRVPEGVIGSALTDNFYAAAYEMSDVIVVSGVIGWQIALSSDPSVSERELATFKKMLSSFKFLGK